MGFTSRITLQMTTLLVARGSNMPGLEGQQSPQPLPLPLWLIACRGTGLGSRCSTFWVSAGLAVANVKRQDA